jgi:starch-binding outer membrane protein, SusD/RagB family
MIERHHLIRWPSARRAAASLLCITGLVGCKGILDVQLPGNVTADALTSASLSGTMVNGVQADFECALSAYIYTTAVWANEMQNASGGNEVASWSGRNFRPEGGTGQCPVAVSNRGAFAQYTPLQIARGQAENALEIIGGFTDADVPGRQQLLARAALYSGFAHVYLGEAYCQVALDLGALKPRAAAYTAAEERFTNAIAYATAANNTAIANAARLGRARARINLGKGVEAAADAKLIPANFVYNATYDATPVRRHNDSYENINVKFHMSVDPAYRNLTVGGVPDPRVIATNLNRQGADAVTPVWGQGKYTSLSTPIPMATWDEAQLIIAEVEGGQSAVDAINRIRTKYNLPQYAAGGTAAQIRAQIIEERRRTLFYDGHRLGDQLRFGIPFATGVNQKGVAYNEAATCISLPLGETTGRPTT